jgi:hypothetical protein
MGRLVNVTGQPLYPWQEAQGVLYRRMRGPQGRSGRVRKIWPPPNTKIRSRTVHPVASRYTDYAIPAHENNDDDSNNNT